MDDKNSHESDINRHIESDLRKPGIIKLGEDYRPVPDGVVPFEAGHRVTFVTGIYTRRVLTDAEVVIFDGVFYGICESHGFTLLVDRMMAEQVAYFMSKSYMAMRVGRMEDAKDFIRQANEICRQLGIRRIERITFKPEDSDETPQEFVLKLIARYRGGQAPPAAVLKHLEGAARAVVEGASRSANQLTENLDLGEIAAEAHEARARLGENSKIDAHNTEEKKSDI